MDGKADQQKQKKKREQNALHKKKKKLSSVISEKCPGDEDPSLKQNDKHSRKFLRNEMNDNRVMV